MCKDCEAQTPMVRCSTYNISKPVDQFPASALMNKSRRDIRCLDCSNLQSPMVTCSICKVSKQVDQFSASAWRNKSRRDIRCLDCSNPPCMFLHHKCETCPQCRNPACRKKGRCTDGIADSTANSQQLPASLEDVRNFACDCCRYVICIVRKLDGTVCGAQRKGKRQQTQARKDKEDYSCGDCRTWLLSQESLKQARSSAVRS